VCVSRLVPHSGRNEGSRSFPFSTLLHSDPLFFPITPPFSFSLSYIGTDVVELYRANVLLELTSSMWTALTPSPQKLCEPGKFNPFLLLSYGGRGTTPCCPLSLGIFFLFFPPLSSACLVPELLRLVASFFTAEAPRGPSLLQFSVALAPL